MEFDDVFKYIGEIGVYQIVLYVLLGLPSYYSGYQNIGMTFLGPDQDHWCEVDRLVELPFETQKYVGIPYNEEDEAYERCLYYDIDYDNYTDQEIINWNWTTSGYNQSQIPTLECDSWVFDQSEFVSTAVSEYDLVCNDSFLVALVSTIYLAGILVGAPISGALSDRYGRKIVLLLGCALQLIFGVAASFSPNYATFVTLRFCTSLSVTFAYLTAFVIIMEVIGPKYRTLAGVFYQIWFAIGFMLLPGMAYFVRDFTNLQIVMAVPVVITVSFIFLIPESPRWLIAQERYDEAEEILQKIAEINGKEITEKMDLKPEETEVHVDKGKFTDLFTNPVLCREILIIYLGWLTNSLVYYGLSLNTGSLVGSVFLNTFISGFVEIPANVICIFGMYLAGRKPTLAWSYIVAGVSAFLCIPFLENEDLAWLVTTFTMIGKAAITICFSTIYVYTAELFPTPVRHLAVGSSSMMSRVGGLVAPFMGEPLMNIWVPMPSVIFGVMGVVSGVLTFLLPETLNKKLPDTIADAEEIGRLGKKKKDDDVPLNMANGNAMKHDSTSTFDNKAFDDILDHKTKEDNSGTLITEL